MERRVRRRARSRRIGVHICRLLARDEYHGAAYVACAPLRASRFQISDRVRPRAAARSGTCARRDAYHSSRVIRRAVYAAEYGGESADLNPSFNTWKFWLSSAAIFAGFLTIALLPSCT